MAVNDTIYKQADFKQAVSSLLPPGEYWQYKEGDQLDLTLEALAIELKKNNDETKLSILHQPDNGMAGWKLSDYQAILNNNNIKGSVFDNSSIPNLIYIDCDYSIPLGSFMQTLEDYRLPHTAFRWQVTQSHNLCCSAHGTSMSINRSKSILTSNEKRKGLVNCAVAHQSLVIHRKKLKAI